MREVWAGEAGQLRWKVLVRSEHGEVLSFVERQLGPVTATSGMAGPALYPGQVVNWWVGRATGLPYFILVRTAPNVQRVTVVLAQGNPIPLQLSPVIEEFGLRFASSPLPDAAEIVELQIETGPRE